MRSHDEMLAEGPRSAPEPRSVEAYDGGGGRLVVREPGEPASRRRGLPVAKYVVPLLFGVFFALQFLDSGLAVIGFIAIGVGATLLELLHGRGEEE